MGTKIRARELARTMPPTTTVPISCRLAAPAPDANTRGNVPMIKVAAVMVMARNLCLAAIMAASDAVNPCFSRFWAASPDSENLLLNMNPGEGIKISAQTWVNSHDQDILSFEEAVKEHIRKAIKLSKGKITGPGKAAEKLNLNPSTLRGKMRKLNIES